MIEHIENIVIAICITVVIFIVVSGARSCSRYRDCLTNCTDKSPETRMCFEACKE